MRARKVGVLIAALVVAAQAASADSTGQGQPSADATYRGFAAQGAIVASDDPLYGPLQALTSPIAAAASRDAGLRPWYVLVRGADPNAFADAGGIVFLTDSLMHFVDNREELAGILCHETAHLIDGDAARASTRSTESAAVAGALASALHVNRSLLGVGGANAAIAVSAAGFSREQESAADSRGARLCAEAGLNPWGLVWLLQKYARADAGGRLEFLADHPTESSRIQALEDEFRTDPETFGRFPIAVESASSL